MQKHVFDMSEKATHNLVADQLRALADQFDAGSVELAYDEGHAPTEVHDPVGVTIDLTEGRREVELQIRMSWATQAGARPAHRPGRRLRIARRRSSSTPR